MKFNAKCAAAVAAILGTRMGAAVAADQPASTEAGPQTPGIAEVVVTAQRRAENAQDVPIAMQAFTGETLKELNVSSFDDLLRYLPNVTAPSSGPGQDQVFMRGLSAGSVATQSGGSISGFPNVAIYLDEQSGQLPGRNLDVYAADLERVEVLEGPQGTLFGAGAQAGVIRYITNKPRLNTTEASVSAGYGTTAGGDPNSDVTAVVNLPVISDTLAVRVVVYDDRHGGYINNVASTFTRQSTDLGIHYGNYPAGCVQGTCQVPPGSPVINNAGLLGNAINPVTWEGLRASALWNINDAWNALITQSFQDMDAEGVFYQMPLSSDGVPLPRQSVTLFNPNYNRDRFENTALVINGKLGDLKLVYAGSYLVRNVDTQQDYTNYARGKYADYYQCHGADGPYAAMCFSPATTWTEKERNTHLSQELRLSTPDDWRLRGIVGAFWEDLRIYDELNWNYKTMPACTAAVTAGCLTDVGPPQDGPPGPSINNPAAIRGDNVGFFNDVKRGYTQTALFTSLDFDLLPKVLTLTAGTRYFHFNNEEKGAVVGSFFCYDAGLPPCLNYSTNIDKEGLSTTYKGFRSRVNLTWHIRPDVLAYYTWSQGFRPGAFNRSTACYVPDAAGVGQYCSPLAYKSDDLTNNELGWKTTLLNHRLQWNAAVYQEDWKNAQVSFFDPGVLGNVGFNTNGPDYRIRGVETSFIALLTEGLTAQGAVSWDSSEQTNSPFLLANNPALPASELGKPVLLFGNPYGPLGTPSANAPPLQFNLRLRYQWNMSSYNMFAQWGVTHTAHSYTQFGSNPSLSSGGAISTNQLRFENPPYTEYDASVGASRDAWTCELFAQNLTNVIQSTWTSTAQFSLQQEITRPRVLGVRLGYKF
ncbi:MAG TPA: TonB-dependent receptor [Steroidobacteraceae bacterium]|nr:TonB-dependent receptor [Steroidobacteraceae bacterium]